MTRPVTKAGIPKVVLMVSATVFACTAFPVRKAVKARRTAATVHRAPARRASS